MGKARVTFGFREALLLAIAATLIAVLVAIMSV
jgi:ABC-type dipeptide/oligopeptide/nickel transport system permease subunit